MQQGKSVDPIIEFRGVYKVYDNGTHALSDVNLKIEPGEFVFVVGASGAGKSTFIKLIIHEEKPNAGEIVVGNFKLSKLKRKNVPKLRRTMGIVFQDFRLIREKTVFENIAFAMHVVGAPKKEIRKTVATALNIVGLSDKARCYPDELSGGEQQRVALARALVNKPDIILADEPTGNVDPHMSYEIVELLTEINRHGTTVIMVTHEHQLVRDFGHRVIMIEDGAIVADDTPTSIPEVANAPERKDTAPAVPVEFVAQEESKEDGSSFVQENENEDEGDVVDLFDVSLDNSELDIMKKITQGFESIPLNDEKKGDADNEN